MLFREGETYRDDYQIEQVEPLLQGEWAVAQVDGKRYYLQRMPLMKPAPPRAIQQYLSIKHPNILPFLEVFSEERSLVFVRPYVTFVERLHQRAHPGAEGEDHVFQWVKELASVERLLNKKPLSMYTLLHPANMGLTQEGTLQVIACGVAGRTLPQPQLHYVDFMIMMLTGKVIEGMTTRLIKESRLPNALTKMLHRSTNRSVDVVLTNMDTYLKKRDSKGLLEQLFRRGEKKALFHSPASEGEVKKSLATSPGKNFYHQRTKAEESQHVEAERRAEEKHQRREAERRAEEERQREKRVPISHAEEEERFAHDRLASQLGEYVRHVFNR